MHVVYAFRKARLEVLDYRQMTKKIREDYYGPGWGRSAPIMIGRGLAGRKPYHEAAAYLMTTKYRNPLAALVVEFTYHGHKFTRNNREWCGTHQGAGRAAKYSLHGRSRLHREPTQ